MKLKREIDFVYYPGDLETVGSNHEAVEKKLTDLGLAARYYEQEHGIEVDNGTHFLEMREGEVLVVLTNTLALYDSMKDFLTDFEYEGYIENFDY